MTPLDDLLKEIFGGKKTALYREFEGWVRDSRRYKVFATRYRGKIRTKLKNAQGESGMKDLRAELATAALLLREESFTLEYEKYAASKQRGADFTVTFKTHTPFNLEVRRIRSVEMDDESGDGRVRKLLSVLCDKVGQMQPNIVNLLWLIAEREISEADLTRSVTTLRQLAESKNEEFFTKRGFKDAADFLKQYSNLSAIVLRQSGENVLWQNSLAKHKVPPEIVNALHRLENL